MGSEEGGTGRHVDDHALLAWSFAQAPLFLGIYDTDDGELRIRWLNQSTAAILRLDPEAVRGRYFAEALPDPMFASFAEGLHRVLATGRPEHFEDYGQAPGQEKAHAWSVSMWPVRDPDGHMRGIAVAALDNSEQHRARQRLALVNEASVRIGSTLDITRTAEELAEVSVPGLADFVSVDLLDSVFRDLRPPNAARPPDAATAAHQDTGAVVLRRAAHLSTREGTPEAAVPLGEAAAYPDFSPPATCLTTGRTVLSNAGDAGFAGWVASSADQAAAIETHGFHTLMAVPLRARGTTLGVAVFARRQTREPFTGDDVLLAEEFAARAAVCVDNARRYTRERATALTLQHSLLPRYLPSQAAVDVASHYQPAGSQFGVGGDWFDVIPLSGARVALVVGDVVGHGVHASATMGRLRTAVRTLADVDLAPDELLTQLDDLVLHLSAETGATTAASRPNGPGALGALGAPDASGAQGAPDAGEDGGPGAGDAVGPTGATCLYAVYDPISRRCTLARAGHPAPVLVTPDGRAECLDLPSGPRLGMGGLPFESTELELPEGSLLALYTDGLISSRERDLDQGIAELLRTLATPAPSLEATVDRVLTALLPEKPVDDVALLLARTRSLGPGRVATWQLADDPVVVADARKYVSDQLARWGLEEAAFVTELVVSELVTNAIRHAGGPIELRLIHDHTLICEVSDGSSSAPHLRRARVYDEGGRGLMLVAQLTGRWGSRQTPTGKTIWAEQYLPSV
ncbi:SpoIIE family protein phosphatase [Allostreptomyces psammosilenae]|uniref:GAF domain-containing protein/anti-sigma regulatory factor (Ser/Thr protein kinase) n=1 Tax=Allostreptomyces psammosilenae TaxID=1892865 RepID=A0A852ZXY6_9ACTN|nr:SpoIIE family protein phosphatase [Allostreptomyces psammosilenae]NYI06905.1 GAF domain-containing protein/anti-sigma regulatory factor (Ser/Thr protein kinase) [Allostreptomyces psammosilenae]